MSQDTMSQDTMSQDTMNQESRVKSHEPPKKNPKNLPYSAHQAQ